MFIRKLGMRITALSIVFCLLFTSMIHVDARSTKGYSSVKIVNCDSYNTFVLANGTLWSFGYNYYGIIGNGTKADVFKPYKLLEDVVDINACEQYAYAIKKDGSLWGWGGNYNGQLGDGTAQDKYEPVKVTSNVKKAFATSDKAYAIKNDDSLWMIGGRDEDGNILKETYIMNDVKDLWYYDYTYYALKTDNSFWTWGRDQEYYLAFDKNKTIETPVKYMDNVKTMAIGEDFFVIKTDGTLWGWGENKRGKIGNGTTEITAKPTLIMDHVVQVDIGYCTFAVKEDGSLWGWGENVGDVLLNTGNVKQLNPVKIMDGVKTVDGRDSSVHVIKKDNSLWGWGGNAHGCLGNGSTTISKTPIQIMKNVVDVCTGRSSVYAVKADGTIWSWGYNGSGMLGDGTDVTRTSPVKIFDLGKIAPKEELSAAYIYDTGDPGASVVLPVDKLADVKDAASAAETVSSVAGSMTGEQKASATGVDRITLFAEEAVAQAASKTVTGSEIVISKGGVDELASTAEAAKIEAEKALSSEGITTAREIDAGVKFKTDETKSITVKIEPDAVNVKADNVYVETPEYAIALSADALKTNVGSTPLVITVTEEAATTGALQPSAVAAALYPVNLASSDELTGMMALAGMDKYLGEQVLFSAANSKSYKISFNKPVNENIKVSLTPVTGETAYQAVMNSKGNAVGGKYNPATGKLDVKVKDSDTYTVKYNKKDFSDIQKKSKEMQEAITVLASKGIIGGTGGTNFSPDAPITRAEIAALILRTLSKLDANANGGFTDVKKSDWYYGAAGSAKKHGIVKGTNAEGTLFSPKVNITKDQIVAISARTLSSEMKYKAPTDVSKYLGTYTDSSKIPGWGKGDIALATRENLVVKRSDGMFAASSTMTRGDAAIILYRMFNKIW